MIRVLFLILVIATVSFSQVFVESPRYMVNDTLNVRTRTVRDFYFNSTNTQSGFSVSAGSVDLDVYVETSNLIAATDTMVIEAYGFKKKYLGATAQYQTLMVGDSVRIGTLALSGTQVFNTYPIDPLYNNFEMFDGLRVVYKSGGSDADSLSIYSNVRIYQIGK